LSFDDISSGLAGKTGGLVGPVELADDDVAIHAIGVRAGGNADA
jgi:hypothetical protein